MLDVGQNWTRVGYSGEEGPRHVFPTTVGVSPCTSSNIAEKPSEDQIEIDSSCTKQYKKHLGELDINYRQPGMEIKTPLVDSISIFSLIVSR